MWVVEERAKAAREAGIQGQTLSPHATICPQRDDPELAAAMALSMEDPELEAAIALSNEAASAPAAESQTKPKPLMPRAKNELDPERPVVRLRVKLLNATPAQIMVNRDFTIGEV